MKPRIAISYRKEGREPEKDQAMERIERWADVDYYDHEEEHPEFSEKWFQDLPAELQEAVLLAGKIATVTSRGLVQVTVNDALRYFSENGIEVTYVSGDAQQAFRERAQPGVIAWMEETLSPEIVAEFMQAVRDAETWLGMTPSL